MPADLLLRQFKIARALLDHHLGGLTTDECLWRPAREGPHVRQLESGCWLADWPEHERYDLGPPSIAWTTWHIIYWWSMAIDHNFGFGEVERESVYWPGTADALRSEIDRLNKQWETLLSKPDIWLRSNEKVSAWPFENKSLADVAAWLNLELMKNAAEIGYGRFLYAMKFEEQS